MSTTASTPRPADRLREADQPAPRQVDGLTAWIDDRTGAAPGIKYLMKKVFPDHWSFMIGEVALFSMLIALLTGVFLTFWFDPSMAHTVYNGSYVPLQGVEMSRAYASTLDISFDIKGGLLIRQLHHWSALLFIVSLNVHMFRVFFTGAFRKPRELNWILGTVLSLLAIIEGFAGYSLPDDLLSGTGLRAMQGFTITTPVIGSYLVYFIFGGTFPGTDIMPRLYSVHILLIPALLLGLAIAHVVLVMVHKHTQYPGPGKTEKNVVGYPVLPIYAAKQTGFFFTVFGILTLISTFFTINAIWVHGPYDPNATTAGAQPDWYMGFADGALRLLPGWLELDLGSFTLSLNIMLGALVLLPLVFIIQGVYPFLEAWVTGDKREHHLLDRPRNAPVRTGLGAAALTAYGILMFAASNDIVAIKFHLSINDITRTYQVLIFVLPPLVFWAVKRICISLQRADREKVLHGRETSRLMQSAEGGFSELHEPLNEYDRWHYVSYEPTYPLLEGETGSDTPGVAGSGRKVSKARAAFSRFYFQDSINPVTPAELEAAHHDHETHEVIEASAEPREQIEAAEKH